MAELKQYSEVSRMAAIIYQLTSVTTIRAVIVLVVLILSGTMLLQGKEVPEWLIITLGTVIGTYFDVSKLQAGIDAYDNR